MANLSRGSSGNDVKAVQEFLIEQGYDVGSTGADGKYGAKTEAAVIQYQKDHGLADDGIVGSKTIASMNSYSDDSSGSSSSSSSPSSNVTAGTGLSSGSSGTSGNVYNNYYTNNTVERDPFQTSAETNDWKYQLDDLIDNPVGDYVEGTTVAEKRKELQDVKDSDPGDYTESDEVKQAKAKAAEVEANKPAEYASAYTDQIDTILEGILNRKAYDVKNDSNYTYLYDLAKQSAMNNADKVMRDTMGAAQGQTGGYGSTYSQMVGQQAADQSLQSLNDNNVSLMSLARSMYDADTTNEYNKLNALNNQDSIDYGRYRDTVGDWQTDRSYYANRADTAYNQDYGQHRDKVSDWQIDRAYAEDAFQNERTFDYGQYQDEVSRYNNDRSFIGGMYEDSKANDLTQYQFDNNYDLNASDTLYDRAMNFAKNGISVPSNYSGSLTEEEIAAINQVAAEANAEKAAAAAGGSNPGNGKQTPVKADGTKWTASDSTDDDPEAGVRQIGKDEYDAAGKVSNQVRTINGEEKVFVEGAGWLTWQDLNDRVNNGTIEEKVGNNTHTYTVIKKKG